MLNSIQGLRAVAAWLVVFHHFAQIFYGGNAGGWLIKGLWVYGAIGVDMFFVISGFVIYNSTVKKTIGPLTFAANRVYRIAPAYWLFTLLTAGLVITFPSLIDLTKFETAFFLKSLLFLPAANPSGIGFFPLLTVGWTLNLEMAFYVIFCLALAFPKRFTLVVLVAGIGLLNLVGRQFEGPVSLYGMGIVLLFLLGVALSIVCHSGLHRKFSTAGAIALTLASIFAIWKTGHVYHKPIETGIPCFLIVLSAVSQERFFANFNLLRHLGDWSYSTYLCHVIILSSAFAIFKIYGGSPVIYLLGSIAVITLVSYLSFKYVELPSSRLTKKIGKRQVVPA